MESKRREDKERFRPGNWRKWVRDRDLRKWLKRDNLIILVLSGILLVVLALPSEDREKGSDAAQKIEPGAAQGQNPAQRQKTDEGDGEIISEEEYAARLEKRLTETLSKVEGVGRVQVMITLKSSQELVVEREETVKRSATNESDTQGGSRVVSQVETGETVVYRSEGTDSTPYVVKTLPPQIEGVIVVAQGAGTGTVNRTVTAIVQALFDVEAHKVFVVKMEPK